MLLSLISSVEFTSLAKQKFLSYRIISPPWFSGNKSTLDKKPNKLNACLMEVLKVK